MNNLVDKEKLTYALNYVKTNGSVPKLTTARTIAISGGATGTATSFDGSANITIPVTSLDATKLTGTASINTTGTAQNAKAIIKTSSITEDTNLDKMLTPGKYFISAKCTNVPHSTSSTTTYGILYVISTGSSNTTNISSGFQIFIHRSSLVLTSNIAIRTYNSSTFDSSLAGWTPWKYLMAHGEYTYSKQSGTALNLNNFTYPGIYYLANTNNTDYTVNNMPGSSVNGWLIVLARQARTYCKQIFFRQGSDNWGGRMIYMRSSFDSSWSDWDPVYVGNGSIRWGTASPSGGDLDGHIYLKYS